MTEPTAAAVVVPVHRVDGAPARLGPARRSIDSTTHAGHTGVPGGKAEPADASPRETARRETGEETALRPSEYTIEARLDDHHTRSTDVAVAPFVGTVHRPERFVPDSREVTDTVWAAVPGRRAADEMDGDRIRYRLSEGEVWGITGRIVTSLLATGRLE